MSNASWNDHRRRARVQPEDRKPGHSPPPEPPVSPQRSSTKSVPGERDDVPTGWTGGVGGRESH